MRHWFTLLYDFSLILSLLSYLHNLRCRWSRHRKFKCLIRGEFFACSWKPAPKNVAGTAFSHCQCDLGQQEYYHCLSLFKHPARYDGILQNRNMFNKWKGSVLKCSISQAVCLMIKNLFFSFFCQQPYGWHLHTQPRTKRKLLQSTSSGPYSPLSVAYNGKICILFKAKRLAIRYRNNTFLDLTERVFGPNASVDTKGSVCTKEKATYVIKTLFFVIFLSHTITFTK